MNQLLKNDVEGGYANLMGLFRNDDYTVYAKTGTTNFSEETRKLHNLPDNAENDLWTVAYTPQYSISLWYGYDDLNSENYMTVNSGWYARTKIMGYVTKNIYSTNKTYKMPSSVIPVEVEKNTIPLSELISYANYQKEKNKIQRTALKLIIVLFLLWSILRRQ